MLLTKLKVVHSFIQRRKHVENVGTFFQKGDTQNKQSPELTKHNIISKHWNKLMDKRRT